MPAGSLMTSVSVTATVCPAVGGLPSVRVTVEPEQDATVTGRIDPLTVAMKSPVLAVEQASVSLNVAVTAVLPAVAEIALKVGGVVSTVSDRVISADDRPKPSIARKTNVCGPSASGAAGVNVHVAAPANPHPLHVTPAVENAPASTFTSIRATPVPNACEAPE